LAEILGVILDYIAGVEVVWINWLVGEVSGFVRFSRCYYLCYCRIFHLVWVGMEECHEQEKAKDRCERRNQS
jgi:hypothetical protein